MKEDSPVAAELSQPDMMVKTEALLVCDSFCAPPKSSGTEKCSMSTWGMRIGGDD